MPEWSVYHTEHDLDKLVFHTDDTVDAIVRRLEGAKADLGKGAYEALETNLGFHFIPGGLLSSPVRHICSITTIMFDWMHVFFVNGVVNHTLGAFFHTLRKSNVCTYKKAYEYMLLWTYPKCYENTSLATFSPEQSRKWLEPPHVYKASASEGRSILPLLSHWVRRGLLRSSDEDLRQHALCVLSLCKCIDELEAAHRRTHNLNVLRRELQSFFAAYKRLLLPLGCGLMTRAIKPGNCHAELSGDHLSHPLPPELGGGAGPGPRGPGPGPGPGPRAPS